MEKKKLDPMPERNRPEPENPRPENPKPKNSPQPEIVPPGPTTIVNPTSPEIDRTNLL